MARATNCREIVIEIPAQKQFHNISSLSDLTKDFDYKTVARKIIYVFKKKASKFFFRSKVISISIFELALSLLGLKLVILMFQRANISLFGEAESLLLGFSYSLGGIIDENEKKNHFGLFSLSGGF